MNYPEHIPKELIWYHQQIKDIPWRHPEKLLFLIQHGPSKIYDTELSVQHLCLIFHCCIEGTSKDFNIHKEFLRDAQKKDEKIAALASELNSLLSERQHDWFVYPESYKKNEFLLSLAKDARACLASEIDPFVAAGNNSRQCSGKKAILRSIFEGFKQYHVPINKTTKTLVIEVLSLITEGDYSDAIKNYFR